jgi:hypothetical protein
MAKIFPFLLKINIIAGSLLAATVATVPEASASGIIVSDAVWSGYNNGFVDGLLYPQQPLTAPGTYTQSFTTTSGATGTTTVKTTALSYPSISLSMETSSIFGTDEITMVSKAELDYYLTVTGPGPGAVVDFTSRGSVTYPASVNTNEGIALLVDSPNYITEVGAGPDGAYYNYGPIPPGFDPNSFTLHGGMYVATGDEIEVRMLAAITVEAYQQGPVSATAYIDPYFFIDPSTPDAGQYSIVTSFGIGNAEPGAVPEPSTWAMMLLGFLGLGWTGNRRRVAALPMRGTPA